MARDRRRRAPVVLLVRDDAVIPHAAVTGSTSAMNWRELSARGVAHGFVNLTKPAKPNVLLTLTSPATVRGPGGVRRSARQLGLHVDDPAALLAALAS